MISNYAKSLILLDVFLQTVEKRRRLEKMCGTELFGDDETVFRATKNFLAIPCVNSMLEIARKEIAKHLEKNPKKKKNRGSRKKE